MLLFYKNIMLLFLRDRFFPKQNENVKVSSYISLNLGTSYFCLNQVPNEVILEICQVFATPHRQSFKLDDVTRNDLLIIE